jgi:hypothetical protein
MEGKESFFPSSSAQNGADRNEVSAVFIIQS